MIELFDGGNGKEVRNGVVEEHGVQSESNSNRYELATKNHRQTFSVTNPSETTVTDGLPTEMSVAIALLCSSDNT
ncbi:hypothetical protein Tco_0806570 [Tanacetum coccineum]